MLKNRDQLVFFWSYSRIAHSRDASDAEQDASCPSQQNQPTP